MQLASIVRKGLVFGLKEEEGEEVISETTREVFEALGDKPRPESVLRLGTKQKEQIRPVLIKLRGAEEVSEFEEE